MAVEFGIWSREDLEFDVDNINAYNEVFTISISPLRFIAVELANKALKAFEVVIYRVDNGPWREYRGVIEHVG
jgi:hypothetical protein